MDSKDASPAGAPADVPAIAEIKGTLKALIEENAGIPASSIRDESTIDNELAMDSLSFVSLQVAVDETFGVECETDEIEKCGRFDAIAALISEKLHATRQQPSRAADPPKPVRVIDGRRQ